MNEIEVLVNGEARRITPTSLAGLLEALGLEPESLATAVNGSFVARGARGERRLADGDSVTIFRPIVGG